MKRKMAAVFVFAMLFVAPRSYGQMMDMDNMKDHMGGGTMENSSRGKEEAKASTQEAEAAGVKVKATYKNPAESKDPVFDVALDTHTVDLDQYKFAKIAHLRDDAGKEYHPDMVSSSGSGHHREATLKFKDADISGAKFVELVVKGVAGVDERVFRFEVRKEMTK